MSPARFICHRRGGLPLFRLLVAATLCWMAAGVSQAGMPGFKLPRGAVASEWGASAMLMGRPSAVRVFEAPGSIADVAAQLLAQAGPDARLMGLPDGLLMTGMTASWLWSIRLSQAGGARTIGVMSGMDASFRTSSVSPHPGWLPASARLRLDLETDEEGLRVRHQVYTHSAKPASLADRLRSNLIRDRWLPVSNTPGLAVWRRGGATLQFSVVDAEGGSGMVIHMFEQSHGGSTR